MWEGLHALVVDDEPVMTRSLRRFLLRLGFSGVDMASENQQAFEAIRRRRPDVIISDVNRPRGDGVAFFRALRTSASTASIPVIISSGNTPAETGLELWKEGLDAFLPKPLEPADLVAALNKIFRRHQDPDLALIDLGQESRSLDYKATLALTSDSEPSERRRAAAELGRDVLAMANSGGGTIVVGVAEPAPGQFEALGVHDSEIESLETTRLNDALRRYIGVSVGVSSRVVRRGDAAFVLIKVGPVTDTLALAAAGHESCDLHPGRIYVRTEDARTAELRDPLELRRLLERLVESLVERRLRALRGR